MVDKNVFIDSCKQVVEKSEALHQAAGAAGGAVKDLSLQPGETCKIMRDLGMRYRKVHHIALSANSQRSMVLRQLWAIKLLEHNLMSTVLLNLDETW